MGIVTTNFTTIVSEIIMVIMKIITEKQNNDYGGDNNDKYYGDTGWDDRSMKICGTRLSLGIPPLIFHNLLSFAPTEIFFNGRKIENPFISILEETSP